MDNEIMDNEIMDNEIMDNENKLNVDDILLEYYNLKNKYEKDYYDKYVKPIVLGNYSKLTKRQKFQELNKPLCINCKQPVGTIFKRKYYEEYNNKNEVIVFTANCGNILNPCDLDIEIHKSLRESYDKLIKKNNEELNKYQLEIIKLKNKILFLGKNNVNEKEYIDEFKKYKEGILYYSNIIGEYTEENITINDNPEESEKLRNLIISLNQFEIMQFKDYIKKYMNDNDDNMLINAINMYTNEIIPKLKEIRDLKYKTMYMNYDEDKNKILVQSKYSFEGMNFYDKDVDEVVKFIKGSKIEETKKSKLKISESKEKSESQIKSKYSKTLKNIGKTSKTKTKKRELKIKEKEVETEELEEPDELEFDVDIEFEKEESKKEESEKEESKELEFEAEIEFESEEEEPVKSIKNKLIKISSIPKKIGEKIILNEATEALEK
jgi:hypothetical protein